MLLRLDPALPTAASQYLYEVKWDGFRAITFARNGSLYVQSRSLRDMTGEYPELLPLPENLRARVVVLDGELVWLDDQGKPGFHRNQSNQRLIYVVFDLLALDGSSTMELPLEERRRLLERLAIHGPRWTLSDVFRDGDKLLQAAREQGLEGVVAKRLGSRYEPGKRSGAWIKVKNYQRADFVVGGWVPLRGTEDEVGSLVLGERDEAGRLICVGSVGTGFDAHTKAALKQHLPGLRTSASPFVGGVPVPKATKFVQPLLIAEVSYLERGEDGLRHPSFQGFKLARSPSG
jgi:bifunctional non-homologous end joining protein LigD